MNFFSLFKKQNIQVKPAYRVGQEWHFDTRPGEENATIKIVKIEPDPEAGVLIHISILGLKIKNPNRDEKYIDFVAHLPLNEDSLLQSITTLKNDRCDLPDYEFGYVRWRTAYLEEQAGYFGIPLKEAIQWLEDGTYEVK